MKKTKDIPSGMQSLRRWISGEADAQDERTLRAEAGDDLFLRDALGGLESFPEGDHAERITRLKGRLRQRSRKRVITPLFVLRRVAAVLVIGLFGIGTWWALRDTPSTASDKSMAIQETTVPPPEMELAEQETSTQPPAGLSPAAPRTEAAQPKRSGSALPQVAPGGKTFSNEPAPPPQPLLADREADAGAPATTIAADTKEERIDATAPQATAMSTERKAEAPPSAPPPASAQAKLRTITGNVTDSNGEPVIGASVRIMGTNQGTVTDLDGGYKLNIPVDAQNVLLQFSYIGYTAQTVNPGIVEQLNVKLDESADALSEVVVTGLGQKKNSRASAAATARPVQPKGGFAALEDFIKKNKRIPPQAASQGISGEVEIEFSITSQGKLLHFKPIRSLGFGCDEEAIRLLQSGPKWENKTGTEQKTSYVIVF